MSDESGYLYCNVLGHSWDQIPTVRQPEFGVPITLRCVRCHTERHDVVNRFTGRLESRNYAHPIDRPKRMAMTDARVAMMNTTLTQARATRAKQQRQRRKIQGAGEAG